MRNNKQQTTHRKETKYGNRFNRSYLDSLYRAGHSHSRLSHPTYPDPSDRGIRVYIKQALLTYKDIV